jgi:RNA polymerase sigma-70 factor (ECF subfamily)
LRSIRCIAQETFLKSYEHVASFDLKRRFFPWIYTLCLNLCRNHLKKKAGKEGPFEETYAPNVKTGTSGADSCTNPENLAARAEAEATLRSAIASLPEEYRAPLILRYSEGLSFQEISEILSLTVGAAKMRVRRGIEMLRKLIPKEEEDG